MNSNDKKLKAGDSPAGFHDFNEGQIWKYGTNSLFKVENTFFNGVKASIIYDPIWFYNFNILKYLTLHSDNEGDYVSDLNTKEKNKSSKFEMTTDTFCFENKEEGLKIKIHSDLSVSINKHGSNVDTILEEDFKQAAKMQIIVEEMVAFVKTRLAIELRT